MQKGFAHITILLLTLTGIVAGVYLTQQRTNLFPKAGTTSTTTQGESNTTVGIPSNQDKDKGKKMPVTVEARFYDSVKDQLRAGDLLSMPAVRQSADTAMTADNWKFKQAISALNNADSGGIILQKGIFLSARADAESLINNIPSSVVWVFYNMEPGMTPASDLQDPLNTVRQFATVVHNSGRKFGFAPGRALFDQYQGQQKLEEVLKVSDMVLYQGQLLLPTMSEENFVKTVKEKYNYVKGVNPNTQFHLQLWLGRQTPDQMAKVFNRSANYMDNAVIGTHTDLQGVLQVLPQLKWRKNPSSDNLSKVESFDDCVKAGYPVMESYPRQCKAPDGGIFTESLPTSSSNPIPSLTATPTCLPRPACLDAQPRCLLPEPADGWCLAPLPTPSLSPVPGAKQKKPQ